MNLVKRLSSFDYAQDGEPVESYLANNDNSYRTTLFVLRVRFTRYERRRPEQWIGCVSAHRDGLLQQKGSKERLKVAIQLTAFQ